MAWVVSSVRGSCVFCLAGHGRHQGHRPDLAGLHDPQGALGGVTPLGCARQRRSQLAWTLIFRPPASWVSGGDSLRLDVTAATAFCGHTYQGGEDERHAEEDEPDPEYQ